MHCHHAVYLKNKEIEIIIEVINNIHKIGEHSRSRIDIPLPSADVAKIFRKLGYFKCTRKNCG